MISYCCKRILTAVPVLLGISLLAFILGVLSPGDPAEFVLNQDGLYAPSEEQLEAMREELGLNKPLWLRYGLWLMGVLQGDLGFMRGALLTEFGRQYFLVAKVRGINKFNLLTRYALPNAIIPVIALLGNYFASVLGGSVIAESIFAIPGISSMALEAIRYRDYPVLQAYVLVSGCTLILVMVTVDLLIAYLNPKVKLGERS